MFWPFTKFSQLILRGNLLVFTVWWIWMWILGSLRRRQHVLSCRLTKQQCLISRFVKVVNTRQQLSFSFPQLWYSLLEFNSRGISQHLKNWTGWNKRDNVWSSANSLFKWRFRYPASRSYIFAVWAGVRKVASADNRSIFYRACAKFVTRFASNWFVKSAWVSRASYYRENVASARRVRFRSRRYYCCLRSLLGLKGLTDSRTIKSPFNWPIVSITRPHTTDFDSDVDLRTGCANVNHYQRQTSLWPTLY